MSYFVFSCCKFKFKKKILHFFKWQIIDPQTDRQTRHLLTFRFLYTFYSFYFTTSLSQLTVNHIDRTVSKTDSKAHFSLETSCKHSSRMTCTYTSRWSIYMYDILIIFVNYNGKISTFTTWSEIHSPYKLWVCEDSYFCSIIVGPMDHHKHLKLMWCW